ncbi:hypothetical protein DFP72DRAFT_1084564 [Ephemerocybe angulata]|uniref:Nucleoplasmin-like domain-containing protein n=1 Tax=Ephemerocybe angulata TaxID=980116 RepID=A0A8H6H6B3_9AGAR|nr:hypothetical protein DFP72DRAFT_1084564 [Tulosesus angulatus]
MLLKYASDAFALLDRIKNLAIEEDFVYTPEVSTFVVNASLGSKLPNVHTRGCLAFGYFGSPEAHCIAAFTRSSAEQARLDLILLPGVAYRFKAIGPYPIDLVGYQMHPTGRQDPPQIPTQPQPQPQPPRPRPQPVSKPRSVAAPAPAPAGNGPEPPKPKTKGTKANQAKKRLLSDTDLDYKGEGSKKANVYSARDTAVGAPGRITRQTSLQKAKDNDASAPEEPPRSKPVSSGGPLADAMRYPAGMWDKFTKAAGGA